MFWADQTAVLERVAAGHPLHEVLIDIVKMIERQAEGMYCSLLLLDDDGVTIRHGAAPSLPEEYARHLDGLPIGPTNGSCGAAAFRRERVIVEDIATHPYWDDYRDLALPFGLRACWSSPIFSADRDVLGTFAMYYTEPRRPVAEELAWVDAATHLAAIAIVSDRATKSLRHSEARAKALARLYSMSNAVNEALARERVVARMYEAACRTIIDHGVAVHAWIGLIDDDSRSIVRIAHGGGETERTDTFSLADDDTYRAAADQAVRSGEPAIRRHESTAEEPARDPTATNGSALSYAVFPMKHRSRVAGVLVLHSDLVATLGHEETNVVVGVTDDIVFAVETAKAAAELRRSEERLRTVIEHTPDVAIQWYDEDGRIIFSNEASRRLFGWKKDDVLGRTLLEVGFWTGAEEARFAQSRAEAAAGQHVAPTQFRFQRPDASEGVLLSTVFRIPLSDSEHCYVCMDVDLTEHRKMEAAVQAGETLRALIYDSVSDIIFYLSVDGEDRYRFQSVNRAFLEATGLREQDVVGRLIDEVISRPSLASTKTRYADAISKHQRISWDEVSDHPEGKKYGEITVSPVYDTQGKCTHLVGTVHDVTERRRAEADRLATEAQRHQAQRLQALGTLAGGIAHDFNNILTAIHCNVDLALAATGSEEDAHENLVEVKQAAQRATAMVRQILTFSRKSEPRRELLELRSVIDETLNLVRVALKGKTKLRVFIADDAPQVHGDFTQVHQAIMNLVTNAIHAIRQRGETIEVNLDACMISDPRANTANLPEGMYARLTVRDDGPGIEASIQKSIFEPFFTTKNPGEGTGLGLSVVHGIMNSHGGAVTVESELGRGTAFTLYFPAAGEKVVAQPPTAMPAQRRQRILFVDDDEAIVGLARRVFARLGHEISAHTDSIEALQEFQRRPSDFDVVVTDIVMPRLDGPALIRELSRIRPGVKIVATSGCIRPEDVVLAQELGVTQLHEKPQSLDELSKLVEADSP